MRQVMMRGLKQVDPMFILNMAAYNLVRVRSLGPVGPAVTAGAAMKRKNRPPIIEKAAEFPVKLHHPKNDGVGRAEDAGTPPFDHLYFGSQLGQSAVPLARTKPWAIFDRLFG